MSDMVNHPAHYGGSDNPYEAIKVIDAWELGFALGNAIKYIARAKHKGSELEDLRKAAWYLNHEIEKLEPSLEGTARALCELTLKLMTMTGASRLEDALRDLQLAWDFTMRHEERNPTHLLVAADGIGNIACGRKESEVTSMTTVGNLSEVTCKDCRVAFLRAGR